MIKKVYKVMTISVIASFVITGCSVKPEPKLNEDVKKILDAFPKSAHPMPAPGNKPKTKLEL